MSKISALLHRKEYNKRDTRWIFSGMLVGSVLSLISSFVLSVEAITLAGNPNAVLTCSVNAVINCASVALHPSAHLLGFPNSFIGLICEPVVITVAIAGLAGVKFPRLFMFVAQIFYSLGFLFALTLLYISMFVIGALCPWCLLVTLTTTAVFFTMTRYNIRESNLYLPKRINDKLQQWCHKGYDTLLFVSAIVVMVAAIILKYGNGIFA